MTNKKIFVGILGLIATISFWFSTGVCDPAAMPKKGSQIPLIQLNTPASQKECKYLGIGAQKEFKLADVNSQLIIVEIIGVYCPQCHKQRPHINRLFHRVQKDPVLSKKVKFIGIAAGATQMEVAYLTKEAKIPYPLITDENFNIHKRLGEPRTPFNMVVSKDGKIQWTHLGIIKDMDAFFSKLKSLANK